MISGWGEKEDRTSPRFLMKQYASVGTTEKRVIELSHRAGHGACKGDSGGPYFCKVEEKPTLVGLTSYGANGKCGRGKLLRERLGFYADVRE